MSANTVSEAEILTTMIAPDEPSFPRDAARSILSIKFTEEQKFRMGVLLDKNNKGELTASEREEMERYSRVGNLIALLQSKARRSLRQTGD